MAIQTALACAFPNDLENAAKQLLQEIGDQTVQAIETIESGMTEEEETNELLDQGCLLLSQIMAAGSGSSLHTCDDVSENFGLEVDEATELDDERFLFYAGIILFDGVFYVDGAVSPSTGDANNIEVLRRLYFSLDRDLDAVVEVLAEARYQLMLHQPFFRYLPARVTSYTDQEVRDLLGFSYLQPNQIGRYGDNSVVVYNQSLAGRNVSKNQLASALGIPIGNLTGYSFSHLSIDNTLGGINRLQNLTLNSSEIGAILDGQDLDLSDPGSIENSLQDARSTGSEIVNSLNFIIDRFDTLQAASLSDLVDRVKSKLSKMKEQHLQVLAKERFLVSTVTQTDTLSRLRSKHTDEKIKILLEQRTEVQGIYFDAPEELLLEVLSTSINNTGPTCVSNNFLNATPVERNYDFTKLMRMQVLLEEAERSLNSDLNAYNLGEARTSIQSYLTLVPISDAPTDTLQGVVCYSSLAGVLLRNLDFDRSFDIKVSLGAIDRAIAALTSLFSELIAGPLSAVITFLANIINAVNASLDRIIETAQATILPLKQRLDAFMSQYMSLIGGGSFDSSLLKCAVNFDIGITTSLFDDLLALINQLVNTVRNMLNSLAQTLADLLEKLLCIPFNLINQFLGKAEDLVGLPQGICSFPRVNMGSELEEALSKLRNSIQFRSVVLGAFNSDLVQFRAIVTSAPDKLSSFRESAVCNNNASAGFFNMSILNLGGGLLGNPIGGISSTVSNAVGGGALSRFF